MFDSGTSFVNSKATKLDPTITKVLEPFSMQKFKFGRKLQFLYYIANPTRETSVSTIHILNWINVNPSYPTSIWEFPMQQQNNENKQNINRNVNESRRRNKNEIVIRSRKWKNCIKNETVALEQKNFKTINPKLWVIV